MNLKTLPLSKQISLTSAALVALIVLTLVGATAWFTFNAATQRTERAVTTQAEGLKQTMDIAYKLSESSVTQLADLFELQFKGELAVDPTQMISITPEVEGPMVTLDSNFITGNFGVVDNFSQMTGGIATVFVRTGEDYLRISTSLKKENGDRAVGTKLDRSHPSYAKVIKGETYVGEALLFGKRYMSKYLPIKSTDGKTDLILFIGFDMTNLFADLQNAVLGTRIGETGVPYVLYTTGSNAGKVMMHSELKGDDFKELAATQADLQALLATITEKDSGMEQISWTDPKTGAKRGEFVAFSKVPQWGGATVIAPALKSEMFSTIYSMTILMIVMGLVATVIIAMALFLVTSRLTGSTKGLTALALKLGNGDMTARAADEVTNGSVNTKNEISLLARSMNRMAESMEQALGAVKRSTDQVQSASEDLVQTSEELSKGAASGSDAASGMAAAVEEMSSSISSVGESATEAKDVSNKARQLADDGLGAINSATQQMHKISENVQGTADVIQQLGAQSREISAIALIIKGIAEQTNLLALNAAIEAARAGEQGRGFSVVADEVRKLAERTRKSTDDIHGMIEAIQNSSGVAVNNMDMAVESVKKGVELVDRAGQAMNQITTDSSAVAHSVENIHAALLEQNQASESIGHQVEVVAQLSEGNLDMARRASNAVSGLKGVATDLSNILKKFQVKNM
ncbi:methyl-accepting chemotaxis protein [Limnobacter parvus]|uniref:Methyl-accepting chemotaxis protein n=1 Tax=Limnobacter parvus TaxID=2939690 RepID=A0ABT1XHE9_9BURK|nr:methyl-accepting chemotaxis protein [Limnobacter parvus]MCR2746707.1 methyl-accepting chemotaxis protein [Limnobacter parvus]